MRTFPETPNPVAETALTVARAARVDSHGKEGEKGQVFASEPSD